MFRSIMFSWRSSGTVVNSAIAPKPALLMSKSMVSPRCCASSNRRAGASGSVRSIATYCARMLFCRPSSLQSVISLSSERATSKTLRPCVASLRAKASPIPEDAPVISVVFMELEPRRGDRKWFSDLSLRKPTKETQSPEVTKESIKHSLFVFYPVPFQKRDELLKVHLNAQIAILFPIHPIQSHQHYSRVYDQASLARARCRD